LAGFTRFLFSSLLLKQQAAYSSDFLFRQPGYFLHLSNGHVLPQHFFCYSSYRGNASGCPLTGKKLILRETGDFRRPR
jgi:hypothetical protein